MPHCQRGFTESRFGAAILGFRRATVPPLASPPTRNRCRCRRDAGGDCRWLAGAGVPPMSAINGSLPGCRGRYFLAILVFAAERGAEVSLEGGGDVYAADMTAGSLAISCRLWAMRSSSITAGYYVATFTRRPFSRRAFAPVFIASATLEASRRARALLIVARRGRRSFILATRRRRVSHDAGGFADKKESHADEGRRSRRDRRCSRARPLARVTAARLTASPLASRITVSWRNGVSEIDFARRRRLMPTRSWLASAAFRSRRHSRVGHSTGQCRRPRQARLTPRRRRRSPRALGSAIYRWRHGAP